ncbi:MAG: hypothetical protein COT73_11675 [Bdellovibrio sp. CG10_big_fil_rev_8_21_14_0_10_47_8]|nr:MAG: hypothetical protein COT73_11675 [Bdellovibrio sp. CG10_big_fil_rev_8_21_14_0_10_47_8]
MNLPILSSQFFQMHKPDAGFFSKWRDLTSWSSQLIPIYEWDGILYVGCSRAPLKAPKLSQKLNVVYVLCEQEVLKTIWYEYQGTVTQQNPSPVAANDDSTLAIQDAVNSMIKTPASPKKDEFSMDNLSAEVNASKKSQNSITKDSCDFDDLELSSPPDPGSMDDLSGTDEKSTIEELNLNGDMDVPANPPPLPAEMTKTIPRPSSELTKSVSGIKAMPFKTEVLYTQPGALSSKKDKPEEIEEITKISVGHLKKSAPKNSESIFDKVFSEMSHHFLKTMILLKEGDSMIPWKWDSKFQAPENPQTTLSLKIHSPFRIVMRTLKPYHGYVVPNEVSDRFFDEWNSSQAPDHLTITPILVEDHVVGAVLALGDKSADNKNSLHVAEKLAEEVSQQMMTHPQFQNVS